MEEKAQHGFAKPQGCRRGYLDGGDTSQPPGRTIFLQSQLDNYRNESPACAGGGGEAPAGGSGELVIRQLFFILALKGLWGAERTTCSLSLGLKLPKM